MEITEHFVFNLSLLMIVLFFALIWSGKKKNFYISKRSSLLWCTILIWSCFQFSYHLTPSISMDMREIPVLIGGLYLGIGPLLSLIVIIIRGFYGFNSGFFANLMLNALLSVFLWRIYPRFWKLSPHHRIYFSVLVSIILSILTLGCLEIMSPKVNRLDIYFAYMVIPSIGIAMISVTIEFVNKNIHMRNKLIKSEKLAAVEQMGAAISHEIRNPLTAARGFVQLMIESPQPLMKHTEYLSFILQELDSAEQVIKNYLTFSKPSLEKVELIRVKEELIHVVNILKPTANQHCVEIITHFDALGSIKADRQKFHQCFLNVMKNAIESMPNGGQLHIQTDFNGKHLTISVKDNGIGMTKEQIDRLGEPYYSTKGSKGTGLGMMVVYSIVRAMNGIIRVHSELGVGTTFRFIFPSESLKT